MTATATLASILAAAVILGLGYGVAILIDVLAAYSSDVYDCEDEYHPADHKF